MDLNTFETIPWGTYTELGGGSTVVSLTNIADGACGSRSLEASGNLFPGVLEFGEGGVSTGFVGTTSTATHRKIRFYIKGVAPAGWGWSDVLVYVGLDDATIYTMRFADSCFTGGAVIAAGGATWTQMTIDLDNTSDGPWGALWPCVAGGPLTIANYQWIVISMFGWDPTIVKNDPFYLAIDEVEFLP